jgi:hypothetical protein
LELVGLDIEGENSLSSLKWFDLAMTALLGCSLPKGIASGEPFSKIMCVVKQ